MDQALIANVNTRASFGQPLFGCRWCSMGSRFVPTTQRRDALLTRAISSISAFPKVLEMEAHMKNSSHLSPVSGLKIYANTGPNSFYGEKYKVEKASTRLGRAFGLGTDFYYSYACNI